jgi:sulfur carrier protein
VRLDDGATVVKLLTELGWAQRTVAVEHNGEALVRSEHPTVVLRDGDVLEIVKAAAGG